MARSFRGGMLIQLDGKFMFVGGYDYLEEHDHFVIEYSLFNKELSIPQHLEEEIVYLKQLKSGEWKLGRIIEGCFYQTNIKALQEIEKYIVDEHCRFKVWPGNRVHFHYLMENFRKIA